jgi:hypothetical protein
MRCDPPRERVGTTYKSRSAHVLGKENPLGLDHEEVDELVHVPDHGIEGFPRHHVVLSRSNLRREAIAKDHLARHLSRDGGAKHHPRQLEEPPEYIEVPNREDKRDDDSVRNGRGTCVGPNLVSLAFSSLSARGH